MKDTLYVMWISPRCTLMDRLIKYLNLDVVVTDETPPEFEVDFPLKKYPVLVTGSGEKLCETIAIFLYLLSLAPAEEKRLLGANSLEYGQILNYMLWANNEIFPAFVTPIVMSMGMVPYDKKGMDASFDRLDTFTALLESRLQSHGYLVGDTVSAADLMAAWYMARVYASVGGKPFTVKFPGVYQWFLRVSRDPFFGGKKFVVVEKPMELPPPKQKI